jgi:hypothetical protein
VFVLLGSAAGHKHRIPPRGRITSEQLRASTCSQRMVDRLDEELEVG